MKAKARRELNKKAIRPGQTGVMNHDVRMIEVAELGSEESGEESKVDNKTVKQYLPIRLRHNVRWRLQRLVIQ